MLQLQHNCSDDIISTLHHGRKRSWSGPHHRQRIPKAEPGKKKAKHYIGRFVEGMDGDEEEEEEEDEIHT